MRDKKNHTLEIIKLIASYMVVFIHVPFYGNMGIAMNALARFAVPLFFMVSGFFSYGISVSKIEKRAKHILKLFLIATMVYLLKDLTIMVLRNNIKGMEQYFLNYLNPKTLIKLFVFNWAVASGHLWYLLALLYVYIILYFFTKYKLHKKALYLASVVLLAVHLLLGEVCSAIGIAVPNILVRNFLLFGIPFFGLGLLAKKHLNRIQAFANSCSNWLILLVLLIGTAMTLASRFLFGVNEIHIGSLVILLGLFALSQKYADRHYHRTVRHLATCSTYVYVFHPMVSSVLRIAYGIIGLSYNNSQIVQMMHPVAVCICSTLLALILNQIAKKLEKKTSKH